ncbi:MAG: flagellar hook-associated protein FlgK [candidate division Zixibacteria bacterium]|nr:flagellar hook-associated protein FlgK [candidate division Zixibacteria bacterium]
MPGLFQGLEIGKRALLTHQVTLQTIGHNISNVNTPGFSRQRVRVSSSFPESTPKGAYGTGIQVDDIKHVRDLFLGRQFREANKSLGDWSYQEKSLTQIESLFNEPQDNALGSLINKFWDSWSDLSTNSDSANNRRLVVTQANQLVNGFQQLAHQLTELRESTDRDIKGMTEDVNRMTSEIARLNQQIASTELGNQTANDLRDTRDQITDELSNIIDVRVLEKSNGGSVVTMGSMVLVDGSDSLEIGTDSVNNNGVFSNKLVWKGTSVSLRNLSGQLAGLTKSRDEIIPGYLTQLNELASNIIDKVNELHRSGYGPNGTTGVNFFDPAFKTAGLMRLNQEIVTDINNIAASSTVDGDNILALSISDLRNARTMSGGTQTINDFYSSIVGNLGVETNKAVSFKDNYELLLHQIENSRQSVQGVSLDEEMSNMIRSQHAYDAAARVITSFDQALDTVINGMGIVGRQ